MSDKIVVGDIDVVKEKGINFLLKNNFLPLSNEKFDKFQNKIITSFIRIIENQNKEIQNYGIIFTRHIVNYIFHLQIRYNANYADKLKYKYLAKSHNQKYDFYLEEYDTPLKKDALLILKLKIKSIIKFFYFNFKIHGFKFPFYILKKKYIYYGSFSELGKDYLINEKNICIFSYKEVLVNEVVKLKLSKKQSTLVNNKIEKCINTYINPLMELIVDTDKLFYEGENLKEVKDIFIEKLSSLIIFYNKLKLLDKKNSKFLISEAANYCHKTISLSLQDTNKVINLHHGYDYCLSENKVGYILLYANNNEVLMDNYEISKNYHYYFENYLGKFSKTNFISLTIKNYFSKIKQNKKNKNKNKTKTKSVMLIGYPMNMTRVTSEPYLYFHSQLIMEFKILEFLKKNKFHVIYKAHPDRLKEIGNIFKDYCDQFLIEKFENVINKADILLFTYPSTSCFGYSLMNQKKIILFDRGIKWLNDNDKKLSKKIDIIPAQNQYSDHHFDSEHLLKVLGK